MINQNDYYNYLEELYEDINLRPYACILLYNYLIENPSLSKTNRTDDLIEEMYEYMDNNEIVRFLFKYNGQRLYDPDNRMMLFKLSKDFEFLQNDFPLRYYYFNFIAESYNRNFYYGKKHIKNIKYKYRGINPEFSYTWANEDGQNRVFEGLVIKNEGNRYKAIRISSLQQTFRLKKGNYSNLELNKKVNVNLHFYLFGIIAEIK